MYIHLLTNLSGDLPMQYRYAGERYRRHVARLLRISKKQAKKGDVAHKKALKDIQIELDLLEAQLLDEAPEQIDELRLLGDGSLGSDLVGDGQDEEDQGHSSPSSFLIFW